jgi:hypothetical protein
MTRGDWPRLLRNPWSMIGGALALAVGLVLTILLAIHLFFSPTTNPYLGILLFVVLPAVLVFALLLVPFGMWRQWRRGGAPAADAWPVLDLNRHSQRRAALIFAAATAFFAALSAVGSYETYHFSETVTFCGTTCHEAMAPEYTTYQHSPHARVACTECHVGAGAGWYVKSKLSGAYQVYAVLANNYPRPIPTPVRNLRPAQETCEQCHWPGKIFGAQLKHFEHTLYDDANTLWPIDMLLKIGGNDPATGREAGIHWHMNIGVEVDYIPRDERRQDIPWVRVRDRKSGEVRVYEDAEKPLDRALIVPANMRRMDCVDCHNRPSHNYRSPEEAVDEAFRDGRIDRALPGVKAAATAAVAAKYETGTAAATAIEKSLRDKFGEGPAVGRAIEAAQRAYSQNIFPEMKASWQSYPNNIGHLIYPGCMRCHDGKHKTADGKIVRRECDVCHTILAQGSGDRRQTATGLASLEFEHPEDIGDEWRATLCAECHSGTQP